MEYKPHVEMLERPGKAYEYVSKIVNVHGERANTCAKGATVYLQRLKSCSRRSESTKWSQSTSYRTPNSSLTKQNHSSHSIASTPLFSRHSHIFRAFGPYSVWIHASVTPKASNRSLRFKFIDLCILNQLQATGKLLTTSSSLQYDPPFASLEGGSLL